MINTALGEVRSETLGRTLTHEHLYVNMLTEYRDGGLFNDAELMRQEVSAFVRSGGGTIVDVSTNEMTLGAAPDPRGYLSLDSTKWNDEPKGRSPANVAAITDLARATGVNVVLGTGHYRDPYLNLDWFDRHSVDDIARQLIGDISEGISGTEVKAGIIGEIGADKWYISAAEERAFRSAARAHLATGVPITTHAARWPVGIPQLELLIEEGVDPKCVVIGHCDTVAIPEYHIELARRGAYVQFDTIRGTSEYDTQFRVESVLKLVSEGFEDRVLLSHDICRRSHLKVAGGEGLTYLHERFRERLVAGGLAPDLCEAIMAQNPQRMLEGAYAL